MKTAGLEVEPLETAFIPWRPKSPPPNEREIAAKAEAARLAARLQDTVEEFVHLAIEDFLTAKGFKRTLSAFQHERNTISAVRPSDQSWYSVSDAIGLPALKARHPAHTSSVLELVVHHLQDAQLQRKRRAQQSKTRAAADPSNTLSTDPLLDYDPVFMYTSKLASMTPPEGVNPDGSVTDDPARGSTASSRASLNQSSRAQRRRSPKKKKDGLQVSQSVGELHKRLVQSQGGLSNSTTALPLPKSTYAPTIAPRRAATASTVDELGMTGELDPNGGPISRSNIQWIPLDARMRMLRREMNLVKENSQQAFKVALINVKQQPSNNELDLAKKREKYSGKKQRYCALCEQPYAAVNLPLSVSFKAIMALRSKWGMSDEEQKRRVEMRPDIRSAAFPHCYDEVRVCTFCAQLCRAAAGNVDEDDQTSASRT